MLAALGFFPISGRAETSDPAALVQRAVAELKTRDYKAALKDVTRAMDQGYRKTSAFNARSAALTGLGRFKEALADAEKSIQYNPEGAAGYLNRAAAREGLAGSKEEILADYKKAAELDKRWVSLYEEAQKKFSQPRPERAAVAVAVVPSSVAVQVVAVVVADNAPPKAVSWWSFVWKLLAVLAAVVLFIAGGMARKIPWRVRGSARQVRFATVLNAPLETAGEPREGAVVGGRYILGRPLGRDGLADVFDGRDLEDRQRTIERVPRRAEQLARAKAAQALQHAAIVPLEACFEQGGWLYLIYEPAAGETLRRALDRKTERRLAPAAALRILQGAADALDHAHGRGVAHGHLTPSQILVETSGARLKGFGLPAEPADAVYLAPEQEAGPSAPAADVFALGVCLFEMLTGRRPFAAPGDAQAKRERRYSAASSLVKDLPAGIDELFARALEPDPERRFRAAGELFGAFRALAVPGVQ